ncbi:hypothetical protein F4777DRAFT_400587 [Nemania sp. FL0916]|nr:hypothetical protein F4777DRAFT_400587 [Nemania sp. FL0916]
MAGPYSCDNAMAAAMGFSSFGTQKPNKRRKFNPSTDAVVANPWTPRSPTISALQPAHSETATTGSNTVPLGRWRPWSNTGEIGLRDDDGSNGDNHGVGDEDPAPQYIDTSRPSAPAVDDAMDNVQAKIDAIVGSSAGDHAPPQPSPTGASEGRPHGWQPWQPHGVNRGAHQNKRGRGDWSRPWWEDYYDPTFIVNPWEHLEKAYGLEPLGEWPSWEEANQDGPSYTPSDSV